MGFCCPRRGLSRMRDNPKALSLWPFLILGSSRLRGSKGPNKSCQQSKNSYSSDTKSLLSRSAEGCCLVARKRRRSQKRIWGLQDQAEDVSFRVYIPERLRE